MFYFWWVSLQQSVLHKINLNNFYTSMLWCRYWISPLSTHYVFQWPSMPENLTFLYLLWTTPKGLHFEIFFRLRCPKPRSNEYQPVFLSIQATQSSPAWWGQRPSLSHHGWNPKASCTELQQASMASVPQASSPHHVPTTLCPRPSLSTSASVGCPGTAPSTPAWTAAGCTTAPIFKTPSE